MGRGRDLHGMARLARRRRRPLRRSPLAVLEGRRAETNQLISPARMAVPHPPFLSIFNGFRTCGWRRATCDRFELDRRGETASTYARAAVLAESGYEYATARLYPLLDPRSVRLSISKAANTAQIKTRHFLGPNGILTSIIHSCITPPSSCLPPDTVDDIPNDPHVVFELIFWGNIRVNTETACYRNEELTMGGQENQWRSSVLCEL
ncbi:hypothetical protein CPB84DRAFT_836598 [Gymnopilus junonius]|uniref:Uncharacterized protein n=1 Tax=Gymnopilus junonius TaxID=109634 RepID=A0A9P5NQC0_GYMJU|nr:hypothetical protein CPB84DRAFT_836598 [Gymnopilus junonius]